MTQCVLRYNQTYDRILVLKMKEKPFKISIGAVYAPTTQSTEEEIETPRLNANRRTPKSP